MHAVVLEAAKVELLLLLVVEIGRLRCSAGVGLVNGRRSLAVIVFVVAGD